MITKISQPIFNPASLEKRFSSWLPPMQLREIGSIFFFPKSDRIWRLPQFLKYCQTKIKDEVKIIDAFAHCFEDIEDMEIGRAKHLIINYAEIFLLPDRQLLLKQLLGVVRQNRFSLLFLFEMLPSQFNNILFVNKYREFYQHVIIYPLYDFADTCSFCLYLSHKWKVQFSAQTLSRIFSYCGGHTWLVKEIVRQMKIHELTLEQIVQTEPFLYKTQTVWKDMGKEAQQETALAAGGVGKNPHIFKELQAFNFLTKEIESKIPTCFQKLITQKAENNLYIEKGEIFFENKNISLLFSAAERRLLTAFLSQKEIIISKDQLANNYWEENWREKFSDWALDQTIYRLRRKLKKLTVLNAIKTVKNKGYVWTN